MLEELPVQGSPQAPSSGEKVISGSLAQFHVIDRPGPEFSDIRAEAAAENATGEANLPVP